MFTMKSQLSMSIMMSMSLKNTCQMSMCQMPMCTMNIQFMAILSLSMRFALQKKSLQSLTICMMS